MQTNPSRAPATSSLGPLYARPPLTGPNHPTTRHQPMRDSPTPRAHCNYSNCTPCLALTSLQKPQQLCPCFHQCPQPPDRPWCFPMGSMGPLLLGTTSNKLCFQWQPSPDLLASEKPCFTAASRASAPAGKGRAPAHQCLGTNEPSSPLPRQRNPLPEALLELS